MEPGDQEPSPGGGAKLGRWVAQNQHKIRWGRRPSRGRGGRRGKASPFQESPLGTDTSPRQARNGSPRGKPKPKPLTGKAPPPPLWEKEHPNAKPPGRKPIPPNQILSPNPLGAGACRLQPPGSRHHISRKTHTSKASPRAKQTNLAQPYTSSSLRMAAPKSSSNLGA